MKPIIVKMSKYFIKCACNTYAWRIRPVLEGFLLFFLIILLLLALGRHKLLGSSGLGEGGGHELADVASLCLDQLLCTRQFHTIYPRLKRQDELFCGASWAHGCHRGAPRPRKGPCRATPGSGSSAPRLRGDECTPAEHRHASVKTSRL